jgi:hypothetical protein
MTEQQKAEARDRRRASDPRKTAALADLKLLDPLAHLEARRLEYVQKLESIAAEAEAAGNLALAEQTYRDLLRLTSLGRTQVALTAALQLEKAEVPDLSMLPPDQLLEIIKRAETMKGPITIELPEKTTGNGHASTEGRPPL